MDLVQNNRGPFDPATYGGDAEKALKVRQAFLHGLPRQEVVDKLIKPINPDAEVRNSFLERPGPPGYDEIVAQNGSSEYAQVDPALLEEAAPGGRRQGADQGAGALRQGQLPARERVRSSTSRRSPRPGST